MQDDPRVPAGWYPTADGTEKYWDGAAWTSRKRWIRRGLTWVGVGAVCVAAGVLAVHATTSQLAVPTPRATPKPTPSVALLYVTNQKDGDSFVASNGKEYRLGLVNAPELDEPCGREAREFSRRFLASGLTVDAYSSDPYGREVAEVFDASGKSLNVALARSGYADDRYLDSFRDENRDLARRLEAAFRVSPELRSCGREPAL